MLVPVDPRRTSPSGTGVEGAGSPRLVAALALALLLAVSGCGSGAGSQPVNPLAGAHLWVDPQSTAAQQADSWRARIGPAAHAAVEAVTSQPVATWLAGKTDDPFDEVVRATSTAEVEAALPVLVAYHRPARDCGSYSAGGSADADAYLAWVGRLAEGIGDRPALVVLEPDGVAQAVSGTCGSPEDAAAVYALLGRAVDVLADRPATRVYVDAGHAGWVGDLPALAEALRASGVERADGFSLNVANFQTTDASVAYGERLSALLDGAQFVVDVSRNGRGAPAATDGVDAWCNPPGAALGENPRTGAERALAVAFLWVKEPGASDGSCRPGEPPAGEFWPEQAQRLVDQRP